MTEGGLAALAGWGSYNRSDSILVFAAVMAGPMHLFVVYVEEPKLERRFGQSYRDYKSGVNRWFPTRRQQRIHKFAVDVTKYCTGRDEVLLEEVVGVLREVNSLTWLTSEVIASAFGDRKTD